MLNQPKWDPVFLTLPLWPEGEQTSTQPTAFCFVSFPLGGAEAMGKLTFFCGILGTDGLAGFLLFWKLERNNNGIWDGIR